MISNIWSFILQKILSIQITGHKQIDSLVEQNCEIEKKFNKKVVKLNNRLNWVSFIFKTIVIISDIYYIVNFILSVIIIGNKWSHISNKNYIKTNYHGESKDQRKIKIYFLVGLI